MPKSARSGQPLSSTSPGRRGTCTGAAVRGSRTNCRNDDRALTLPRALKNASSVGAIDCVCDGLTVRANVDTVPVGLTTLTGGGGGGDLASLKLSRVVVRVSAVVVVAAAVVAANAAVGVVVQGAGLFGNSAGSQITKCTSMRQVESGGTSSGGVAMAPWLIAIRSRPLLPEGPPASGGNGTNRVTRRMTLRCQVSTG